MVRTCGYSLRFPGYQIRPVISFEANSMEGVESIASCFGFFLFQTQVSWKTFVNIDPSIVSFLTQ